MKEEGNVAESVPVQPTTAHTVTESPVAPSAEPPATAH
jgi:sec-independent protein translocase protein TatA